MHCRTLRTCPMNVPCQGKVVLKCHLICFAAVPFYVYLIIVIFTELWMEVLFIPSTVPRMWSRSWKWRWVESKLLQLCIVSKMWWIHKFFHAFRSVIEQVVSAFQLECLFENLQISTVWFQKSFKLNLSGVDTCSTFRWIQLVQSPFHNCVFMVYML